MPSLNALKEFKASFQDIANERKDVELKELPFDDLALPTTEPPPFNPPRQGPSASSDDLDIFDDFTNDAPPSMEPDGDFDFSAFLNDLSSDAPPSVDDIFDNIENEPPESEPADSPSDSDDVNLDDFFSTLGSEPAEPSSDDDLLAGITGGEQKEDDSSTLPEDMQDMSAEDESSYSEEETYPLGLDENTDSLSDTSDAIDMGGESQTSTVDMEDLSFRSMDMDQPEVSENGSNDGFSDGSSDDPTAEISEEALEGDTAGELNSGIDLGGESPDFVYEEKSNENEEFSLDDLLPDTDPVTTEPDVDVTKSVTEPVMDDFGADLGDMDFPTGDDTETQFDDSLGDMDFSEFEDHAEEQTFDELPADADPSPADTSLMDDFGADLGNMDFPTGEIETLDPGLEDFGSDFSSDMIDLSDVRESETLSNDAFGDEAFGSDDFHIEGLDEIFEKTKTEIKFEPTKKKGFFRRKKRKEEEIPEPEEDVEEIALTQEDVNKLLKTLSAYPLNMRIACQELIAEQVILPQQLSKLIRLLVTGAHIKETALHVEQITGKPIVIPKSFEKGTGAAFEAEQSSFAYIFIHNFLPVLRLFAVIAALAASVIYISYQFIYLPLRAESLYQRGYERIAAGEYQRANDLFHQAFSIHRNKKWFYAYAEAFRDQRRFMLAEGKYDELLRFYPRDKKGVLDYAHLNTYFIMNFEKANRLLQQHILDFNPNDYDALLAAGDNFLAWADSDPSRFSDKYEDARFAFARLLELNGWRAPIVERMLKYFIRTDNLKEVLHIRVWFENDTRRRMSTETLAELGGYLLDKQLERPTGVPNPFVESIESVRDMLLQAVREDRYLPEPHYHLARYYHSLGNTHEERLTLENAIRAFDLAKTESVQRRVTRVDAHFRYSNLLVNNREFFPAEAQLVRGIELYEEFLNRNLLRATPQLGQLYAAKGDLEFYVKTGDRIAAENALRDYRLAERFGYHPPEMLYRMGAAFYQLEDWGNSLNYLFRASADMPLNRRVLFALGNVTYQRGDYFAAQGYFDRLLDTLEGQRVRMPALLPSDNPQFLELGERLMMARNNAGVVYEALAEQTGNREYRSRALALYAESARAWDSITRNPTTMTRMSLSSIPGAPGINLGYLNANNAMRSISDHEPQIFVRIDRDGLEPSHWEQLAPFGGMQ